MCVVQVKQEAPMKIYVRLLLSALSCYAVSVVPAVSQEAILPHGDPGLRESEESAAKREEIRDSRLKQQGQGSNYRIEGDPQPSTGIGDPAIIDPSRTRQNTGMEDPSVNPGQAAGMQRIQGRVIKSQSDRHTVRQLSGPDTTVMVDAKTAGDKDLHPGDLITGVVTSQGRAVVIKKEQPDSSGQ
jgi:hypothetical protein